MSSIPAGCGTIGPIYEMKSVKEKFIEVCKAEDKTMESKLKELIRGSIKAMFPEYAFDTE